MSRYIRHGNGREWRRGVYRIEALPKLDAMEWKNPRRRWGSSFGSYTGEGDTTLDLTHVPEGLAALASCRYCGGRHEAIFPGTLVDMGNEFPRLLAPFDPWRNQHAHCGQEPIRWRTPGLLEEFLSAFIASSRLDLARGVFIDSCVHLLATDARAYSFFSPALPASDEDALVATEEFRASVRAFIRERKLDLLAAVVTGESWVHDLRQDSPVRQEGLSIAYVTADYGKASVYPIRRHAAGATTGPGELLPEALFRGVPGSTRWLDTLFA
ncbi:hypothetical protein [Longimicrobium terrae]|uniref:Uncharacterized protein n=1 Tax=Longimicrobium terrae TaxID=1639882 RepID=A0A841GWI2_9BACT|nr:hypothetical protein [Longimicrobium terrae]MBB4635649.1 hypothetical protein [Longimicrobium terrae]MBB6070043.1 hypothetical protein [Longimicrobium terrae]NNC32949.1 hypothetical protein [Longimicrobium terrae]